MLHDVHRMRLKEIHTHKEPWQEAVVYARVDTR
jgi:hypothetical protein